MNHSSRSCVKGGPVIALENPPPLPYKLNTGHGEFQIIS